MNTNIRKVNCDSAAWFKQALMRYATMMQSTTTHPRSALFQDAITAAAMVEIMDLFTLYFEDMNAMRNALGNLGNKAFAEDLEAVNER